MADTRAAVVAEQQSRSAAGRPRTTRVVANPHGSIPERLQYLLEVVRPPGENPVSAAEIARWINEAGGAISSVYVLKILKGERQPALAKLQWLAKFFGVPIGFFLDEEPSKLDVDTLVAQMVQRRITSDPQVLLMKIAQLSSGTQAALNDIIDNLLVAEGKTPAAR